MDLIIKHGKLITMNGDPSSCDINSIDASGKVLDPGDLLIQKGKIVKIAPEISPADYPKAAILDCTGYYVLPGIIESHCHIGITEEKKGLEGDDGNETTTPLTPYLRGLDAINPMDAAFKDAIKAGITSVMVGPGSSNVVGGQFLVMKTGVSRCIDDLVIKHPAAMKASFGENPKTNYGDKDEMPSTRMAIAAMLREELTKAKQYQADKMAAKKKKEDFTLDFRYECWLPVLNKEIPIKAHCHRTDDIFTAIRIAKEFDLRLTLDHCSEGHLIAKEIKKTGFPTIIGPDLASRSKIEVENMAFKTAGILNKEGILVSLTTDHPVSLIQSLPLCAGLAAKYGLGIGPALRAITINAAKICEVDCRVGSLATDKDADIAIFDGNPLEVFTRCLYTIIDGEFAYRFDKEEF